MIRENVLSKAVAPLCAVLIVVQFACHADFQMDSCACSMSANEGGDSEWAGGERGKSPPPPPKSPPCSDVFAASDALQKDGQTSKSWMLCVRAEAERPEHKKHTRASSSQTFSLVS